MIRVEFSGKKNWITFSKEWFVFLHVLSTNSTSHTQTHTHTHTVNNALHIFSINFLVHICRTCNMVVGCGVSWQSHSADLFPFDYFSGTSLFNATIKGEIRSNRKYSYWISETISTILFYFFLIGTLLQWNVEILSRFWNSSKGFSGHVDDLHHNRIVFFKVTAIWSLKFGCLSKAYLKINQFVL